MPPPENPPARPPTAHIESHLYPVHHSIEPEQFLNLLVRLDHEGGDLSESLLPDPNALDEVAMLKRDQLVLDMARAMGRLRSLQQDLNETLRRMHSHRREHLQLPTHRNSTQHK